MSVQSDRLPATTFVWQPAPGKYMLAAVAKATLLLAPGESQLCAEQEPISEGDGHWDDNPARSLFIPSDIAPPKPRIDVVAVGHAYAPKGQRVRSLVARLSLGTIDKAVEIFADRALGPDGSLFESGSFARMPLVYERTRGGAGTWNPVGIGREERDRHGNVRLPNIQALGAPPTPRLEPIGFGPLSATWALRIDRVRYAGGFNPIDWNKRALPEGFDLSFFNVAPPDQQLDVVPNDAVLALEHLHPEHPRLSTRLPKIEPRAIFDVRGAREEVAMRADTFWIDVDRGLCTVVYRGQTSIERPDAQGSVRVLLATPQPKRGHTPTGLFKADLLSHDLPFARQHAETTQTNMPAVQFVAPDWMDTPGSRTAPPESAPRWSGAATPFAPSFGTPKPQPASRGQAFTVVPTLPNQPATRSGPPSMPASTPGLSAPQAANPGLSPPPASVATSAVVPLAAIAAPVSVAIPSAVPQPIQARPPLVDSPWAAGARTPAKQPAHAESAALLGLTGASNAAADVPARAGATSAVRKPRGTAIDLLWFDPEVLPRVRRKREWKSIIDELESQPFDPEIDTPGDDAAADVEDRREILQLVTRGKPSPDGAIEASLDDAVRDDGRFAAPLLLLAGELTLDFDELEILRAVVSIGTPLATQGDELKTAIEQATAYLAVPGLVASADVATSLTTKIREAFASGKRAVPSNYLDTESERALLERRAFKKRDVFGAPHIRGSFFFAGSTTGVPTYLPESLGKKLPLFRRIAVRLLTDVAFQADQYESHPTALRSRAVARVVRGGTA